ncbi:hypothetical protein CW751_11055 [Brumimicrobium salinarum]|uniref:Secretion system C-terminal sorting domain-containing protein n=1 Tax=Brumimicrobium salinarum TaxID=2058658 RepID=A0A2I0R0U9_9FLAO|nr:T9SS type A sorting domain-containing protein [Brumimicrobium salinarum]PKR80193.1 hypothetical protein CW751_11055 [Brumimicrobium salinarum]
MRALLISIVTLFAVFHAKADLSIEGSYQGKNLYVQNPASEDGFGFCVTKVTVNNNIMPGGVGRSAFEIDFSLFNVDIGEEVFIVIEHGNGCVPKILNPEVLLPRSTFEVTSMTVDKDGSIEWVTTGEQGELPYVVEQYRWSKWVSAGEVDGTGEEGPNTYSYKITPHHGENKVRVVQKDHSGTKRKSPEKTFESTVPAVEMSPTKVKSVIKFTANGEPSETKYEIYDAYGNIVKKGYSDKVNCENLRKGAYYINFDNKNEKFIKS